MKMLQFLPLVLLPLVMSDSSSEWPLGGDPKAGGGGGSSGGAMAQTHLHHELEPKNVRRERSKLRNPLGSFVESDSSRTETGLIPDGCPWLGSIYDDLTPPDARQDGMSKSNWFAAAWNGAWALFVWDKLDTDYDGLISEREIRRRWPDAMLQEFGSPSYSPKSPDFNGYFECMAYTVLLFRKWDANEDGALDLQEIGESKMWQQGLVGERTFNRWAADKLLRPSGFMAVMWHSLAQNAPLFGRFSEADGEDTAPAKTPDIRPGNISFKLVEWLGAIFEILDANADGVVRATEWFAATSKGTWADVLWHKVDRNTNGELTESEFQQEMPSAMLKEFGGAPPSHGNALNAHFSYVVLSTFIFRRLDANTDGRLHWTEFENSKLRMYTAKEDDPICGNVRSLRKGVISQAGFNMIARNETTGPTLEFEQLVSLFEKMFSAKFHS